MHNNLLYNGIEYNALSECIKTAMVSKHQQIHNSLKEPSR